MMRRGGMSLLEVVLALAILGVALAMIGELIRLGSRAGEAARNDLESQLICESVINEVAAGVELPELLIDQPVDELGEWLYSVETQPVDEAGLLAIRVSVRRADAAPTLTPVLPYTLTRWVIDPEVEMVARQAEALMEQQLKERAAAQASGTQASSTAAAQGNPGASGTPQPTPNSPDDQNKQPRNQRPDFDPSKLPPDFDPSKLPPGFDPSKFDPSKLPPGFDPSKIDLSKLPPGLIPGGRGQRGGGGPRGGRGGGPGGGRSNGS